MQTKKILLAVALLMHPIPSYARTNDNASTLDIGLDGIRDGAPIPEKFVACLPASKGARMGGGNASPAIHWEGAPAGTRSYAVMVVDKDVPADHDAANKLGRVISKDAPRKELYHWVVVDIPPGILGLPEGAGSKEVPQGRFGRNDMAERSKGKGGYDGPCPPWNDERLHHYHFEVYALDVPTLGLNARFHGQDAKNAMRGHILAKGEVVGTYTTNPKLLKD